MKRILFGMIGCALLATFVWAQSEDDYRNWMKANGANAGALRKNIEAKSPGAAQDAQKLAETMMQVQAYWAKNNAPDAVNFAKTGHDAAMDVASAATAGDWDKAAAGLKTLQAQCGGCHMAHRDKAADGSFKIK